MTGLLFQDFVCWFDAKMTGRKVLLIVDNCSAHPKQDPDNSSFLSHVSPKEVFLAVDTLKNYLIQHKKNIPHLVYALLKVKR
ncbi:hypothetical protein Godav_001047 [Gossypium davidsonii]|uniref:DDE-1 domain-containing protein n=1 Tax=Gossypium davidsonii TaxID=34287 RepID=A0A7J8T1L7_GOSDV|nr:hypothetical protein [Gossypium davidsonii]